MRSTAVLWAAYYFCTFTVGRFEQWTQPIIWGGGGLVVLWTLFSKGFRRRDIPSEALFIVALLYWSLFSGISAPDPKAYGNYFKLCFEMLLVVALMGAIVRKSGALNVFWWAFIVVAVFNTAAVVLSGSFQISGEMGQVERAKGLTGGANSLAFLCFMGILGALALVGEKRSSLRVKTVALGGAAVAFWGVIASGSRGSYLLFVLVAILWPLLCLGSWRRHKWRSVFVVLLMIVAMCYVALWVQGNTLLGGRIDKAAEGEDGSATTRLDLVLTGLEMTKDHPLTGVGLGQFGLVSKMGLYAHNEWIELLATTGIPGFLFFMSVYISTWRRLTRSLKYINDPTVRYRVKFARMTLMILLVSGAVFRPNFLGIDTIFLIALVVGISHWAEDAVKAMLAANRHSSVLASGTSITQRDRMRAIEVEKIKGWGRRSLK